MNRNQQQIYQDVHRICESLEKIIEIMNTIHEQKIKDNNRKV